MCPRSIDNDSEMQKIVLHLFQIIIHSNNFLKSQIMSNLTKIIENIVKIYDIK